VIHYENKHFIIDGKKTFLYGAECHYFRLDPAEWKDRLEKIRAAGFNLVSTYVPWIWHEPIEGQFDFEGVTHPRRNLKAFLDLCVEYKLYCVVRPGPYVMSELKNEGIPEWLLDNYPQMIARTPSGDFHPTRVVSYLHPTYLEFVEKWYREVSKYIQPRLITTNGSIIMFQLDNEVGMLHWVTNTGDHHPDAEKRFEAFRKQSNQSDRLDRSESELTNHWLRTAFGRQEIAEYIRVLRQMARDNGIDVPFIVNVHGFKDFSVYSRGVDYPIGLSQLREAATVDDVVLAGDFYPGKIGYDNFHDLLLSSALTDAMGKPNQPLFSAEFQSGRLSDRPRISPSDVDLITRICVASGMNALNYYMYCGGDNVEGIGLFGRRHEWQAPVAANGDLRPSYAVTSHLGQLYQVFGEALCESPKLVDTYIGFYSPYYATETVNRSDATVKHVIGQMEAEREHLHFDGLWRLLSAANITYAAIDVQKDELDAAKLPTFWMATTKYMDKATQEKLVRYVVSGGKLVLGPQIPLYDLNGDNCDVLAKAVGAIEVGGKGGFQRVTICDMDSVFCRHYTIFKKPEDAKLVAFSEQGETEATAYCRDLGQGQVLVLGVGMTHEYQYQLEVMHRLAKIVGIEPRLSVSDESLVVSERAGLNGSLISVLNVDDVARQARLFQNDKDLFGGEVVELAPRSGKLLPVNFTIAEGVTIHYSTVEVVRLTDKDTYIDVEVYVPAGQSGVISWQLGEGRQLETAVDASIVTETDGAATVARIAENSKPSQWQFRIIKETSAVGAGATA